MKFKIWISTLSLRVDLRASNWTKRYSNQNTKNKDLIKEFAERRKRSKLNNERIVKLDKIEEKLLSNDI